MDRQKIVQTVRVRPVQRNGIVRNRWLIVRGSSGQVVVRGLGTRFLDDWTITDDTLRDFSGDGDGSRSVGGHVSVALDQNPHGSEVRRHTTELARQQCDVKIVQNEETVIAGSETMQRSAIENVVRNAIRYTDDGTNVELSLVRRSHDGRTHAIVEVRDHGPGVETARLVDIFKPFYRLSDARERSSGGVGLGLAITDRIVKAHGGTVEARNAADRGLIVSITIQL